MVGDIMKGKILYNKFFRKAVSFTTASILLLSDFSFPGISELISSPGYVITAEAAYDTSRFSDVSNMTFSLQDFAEYSRCYANDSSFAALHKDDVLTLNPTAAWKLDSSGNDEYIPLGTSANPFNGTIRINALAAGQSTMLLTEQPLFNVVNDSVAILVGNTSDIMPLEFIRISNGDKPLMANEVRHTTGTASWKLVLSNQTKTDTLEGGAQITYGNFYTYGGVIGKMTANSVLTIDFKDDTTSTDCYVKRSSSNPQGIICGEMLSGATLTTKYVNSTNREIQVGETSINASTGGLVGSMDSATLNLDSGSSGLKFKVISGNSKAGLVVGDAKKNSSASTGSVIRLSDATSFFGSVTSTGGYVGGLVGSLVKSDIMIGSTGTGSVTLSGVTVSGTNKTGGAIGYFEPTTNASNALKNITYNMTNCTIKGTKPGGIYGEYKSVGGEIINVNKYSFTGTKFSSGSAGGVFGVYTANGNTTLTGTYSAPESSVPYGGVIGDYSNSTLSRELKLDNLTVNSVKQTSNTKKLGGVILNVTGSSYITVNDVTVNVTGGADKSDTGNPFGGIVSTLGSSADKGCFIDVKGNYTLTTNTAFNGGAIAGSFKNGVLRLAGLTDISGAQTANGYGQLIYENDTTLVYSVGTGSNYTAAVTDPETGNVTTPASGWTLKRNDSTSASDLGQWGEVVRFSNMETDLVTVNDTNHTVTLKPAVTAITNPTTFAKLALNMQLNDGLSHSALLFDSTNPTPKSTLLSSNSITVSGNKISLTGTGLLGLTRDGGNGKNLNADGTFAGSPDFFTGTITGADTNAEIELAVGEAYGCDSTGAALSAGANGGRIYLSENYGHDAQGLIGFGNGASISSLKISGAMNVSRKAGTSLYISPIFGVITGGASLSSVNVSTNVTLDKEDNSFFYVGGVAGIFDGTDTSQKTLSISGGSIAPSITLNGSIACTVDKDGNDTSHTYAGGVLGLLRGASATNYKATFSSTDISPTISIGSGVSDTTESYIGGVIGFVKKNTTNEREITFTSVTMTNASVDQKSQHSGGLLGSYWHRTKVNVNGLTITGSKVDNKAATLNELSGLVYCATGNWSVNTLSISGTTFSAVSAAHPSFGLIVNKAYDGDDGLYLNLKNAGYTLSSITIPSSTASSYYVDEIAANTASSDDNVVSGGNGTGIININMNAVSETKINITDRTIGETTVTGTGTYQNKALSNNKLIANQHSRYYYNLDVIKANTSQSDGEKFLMWSIYNNYAPANIKGYNVLTDASLSGLTSIDLTGLSYYPVNISSSTTLPSATYTFAFNAVKTLEAVEGTDSWARYPDSTGNMTTTDNTRRNQHYLMQNGLFVNVSNTLSTSGRITLAGDFGGVGNAGVIVGGTLTGNVNLTNGVTLSNIHPSSVSFPMLVNYIDGTASDVNPVFKLTGLRLTGYPSTGTTAVASALINNAEGTGMQIVFSDIKLDARNGNSSNLTSAATSAMNNTYLTSRSIFNDATLIKSLKSNSSDTIEYYYTWEEDWGTETVEGSETPVTKRNVTYGQEVNVGTSATYPYYYKDEDNDTKSGERNYSGEKSFYTNPIDGTNTEFDFSIGFLPYVKNKNTDSTYNISEVKVNYVSAGLTVGCGTYNDPYVIDSAKLLKKVAEYINNGTSSMLDTVRLPNALNSTWHETATGDSLYDKNSSNNYTKHDNSDTSAISTWTGANAREYLAGAYYMITNDMVLPAEFPGIGKGGASETGKTVFHGVIVGQKKANDQYPTITNYSANPFIYISNGTVIKNLNFVISNSTSTVTPIEIAQANAGGGTKGADYTYSFRDITDTSSGNKTAKYYGGIFGEIMGGDNIVDGVTVTYNASRPIKVSGNNKQLVAVGGVVGAIVNGGLIFRGTNTVTGFTVYDNDLETNALAADHYATIYANPYVGRVINGYAVNESSSTLNNTNKHYTIDSITVPSNDDDKLTVSGSAISVPNAQALFVMSLITQSTAGTAASATGDYGVSQSYGINSGNSYFCGTNHLGTYDYVGAKKTVTETVTDPDTGEESEVVTKVMYTDKTEVSDYNSKAKNDVANAVDATRKTAIPYIIFAYTKASSDTYPARTITNGGSSKYWNITLGKDEEDEDPTFDMTVYTSFRGIGCMGNKAVIYSMKVATFNGNDNKIKLSMLESRYGRDAENYYHQENKSTTTAYEGEVLDSTNYGHDQNLHKLLGLGLFDSVNVKYDATNNPYQFQNIKLKGSINEIVYNKDGTDITGNNDQSQLFCIGGVVGKRITNDKSAGGNVSDLNFKNIIFDGLTISGAYSCGGLIGLDALKSAKEMKIVNCNSTSSGVEVTGGYYGKSSDKSLRHGVGSFVGMTFMCRPYIDGDNSETPEIEKADIFVSKVSTHYTGSETRCNVGGLIGYSGTGAEIKNIKLRAANSNSVVGASNVANAAGFIGYAQAIDKYDTYNKNYNLANCLSQSVYIENCTLENISVRALNSAAGFYGRCNNVDWSPMYIYISDCSIIGTGDTKPEIRAYGNGTSLDVNYVGGFVARFSTKLNIEHNISIIQDSYISGYKVQGYNVGGMIGYKTQKPMNIKNVYVKDCDIVSYGNAGGFVGYSDQNLNGYNMKIENVNFNKSDGTDNTSGAGAFVGNASSQTIKFIAVAKYHTDVSKIPVYDIKSNGSNSFLVFSDYTGQSLTSSKNTENISTFGKNTGGGNVTDQNEAPYLTINPSSSMGTGGTGGTPEYISSDAAYQLADKLSGYDNYSSAKSAAARIYADYSASSPSNRAYILSMTGSTVPSASTTVSLESYFKQTKDSSNFKVSTWNTEMGAKPGVDDFTLLVINDANDPEQTTDFIDNYIRLMTNTSSHYMADNSGKYRIVVSPCQYDATLSKFKIISGTPGLIKDGTANVTNTTIGEKFVNGYYQMSLANADSKSDDRFTLIDVQFLDPTDTASNDSDKRIAYHLYVPVLTKKTVNIEFSAASISGSEYKASNYTSKISSEIASGKNANIPTTIVDSMDVWTTTYIRFSYPVSEVNELLKLGALNWNHDKKVSIVWTRENNIPNDTKMVLIDPNNNKDKAYYSTAGSFSLVGDTREIDFSVFTKRLGVSGNNFTEQSLYSLLENNKITPVTNSAGKGTYDEVAEGTEGAQHFLVNNADRYFKYNDSSTGAFDLTVTEALNEEYYLSLYVPKTEGQADVVQIQPSGMLGAVDTSGSPASGNTIRATVTSKLNSALIIGDFYQHTVDSLTVASEQNSQEISAANKKIITTTVATISLIDNEDHTQASYFATTLNDPSISLYHSFNIQMIRQDSATSQPTDIIEGINKSNITATYKINDGEEQNIGSDGIIREINYIQCTTGDIKSELVSNYTVTITGVAEMTFDGFNDEFPPNAEGADGIGVRGAVRSNIAYQTKDLPYSKMFAKQDPVNPFYYTTDENSAQFSFDAVDELDDEEIGFNTKNYSRLGVNNHFPYTNILHGKSVYNANDVKDYEEATYIKYTLELYRKTTINGLTTYQLVNIPDYLKADSISLVDPEVGNNQENLTRQVITVTDNGNSIQKYVYSRPLYLDGIDKDAIFTTNFGCEILKDSAFLKKEYANYRIQLTVELLGGPSNSQASQYIVYTNAKLDPTVVEVVS
ncbi:hypothetical protein SAMN02910317_01996 [Ruminococcaceae bacterium FB2012]|nr:hypothetical protein SAMN02910317_01996 [Ruminococcaceae bacterium FB2012]